MRFLKITLIIHEITEDNISLTARYSTPAGTAKVDYSIENPLGQATQDKLQWYFENSLETPVHVNKTQDEIMNRGMLLFKNIFSDAVPLYANLREDAGKELSNLELEIIEKPEFHFFPWELLTDPATNLFLILTTKRFIRSFSEFTNEVTGIQEPIRVLLIISRPLAMDDINLRTIALSLQKIMKQPQKFEFTILRPPTFTQLTKQLAIARQQGNHFHILHFDGHGVYGNETAGLNPAKGYLVFESDDGTSPIYIDGHTLGKLLTENKIDIIVMNACRSGFVDAVYRSEKLLNERRSSLACDIHATGVGVVISMRYKVGVTAAMTFMQIIYNGLADGLLIEEAFHIARIVMFQRNVKNEDIMLLELFLPSLIMSKNVKFVSRSLGWKDKFRKLFSSPKEPERYQLHFDNLTIETERLLRHNQVIILWGAITSGRKSFINDFRQWSVDSRLFRTVHIYNSRDYQKNDFIQVFQSKLTEPATCIILEETETWDIQRMEGILKSISIEGAIEKDTRVLVNSSAPLAGFDGVPMVQVQVTEASLYKSLFDNLHKFISLDSISNEEYRYFFELCKGNIGAAQTIVSETAARSPSPSTFFETLDQLATETITFSKSPKEFGASLPAELLPLFGLLHIVHNGFSIELLKEFFSKLALSSDVEKLLESLFKQGWLIQANSNSNIYQLHPLMVGKSRDSFYKIYTAAQIRVIDKITEEWITKQYSNIFTRRIAISNCYSFLSFKITNDFSDDCASLLDKYRKEVTLSAVKWNLLIEKFSKKCKNLLTADGSLTASEKSMMLTVVRYYVELSIYRGEITMASQYIGQWPAFINLFFTEIDPELPMRDLEAYAEIFYMLTECEVLKASIDAFSRPEEFTVIPLIYALRDIFLSKNNTKQFSRLSFILSQYQACREGNLIRWYHLLHAKKDIYTKLNAEHPDPLVKRYLTGIKDYNPSNVSALRHQYLVTLSTLTLDKKEYIGYAATLNIAEMVLGKQNVRDIPEVLKLYGEAAMFADAEMKKQIAIEKNNYLDTINCKLLFPILSNDQLEILMASGIYPSPSLTMKLIRKQMELLGDDCPADIVSYTYRFMEPLGSREEVENGPVNKALELILDNQFTQATKLIDQLNYETGEIANPLINILHRYELISYLYTLAPLESTINFYETSIIVFIREHLKVLFQHFNEFSQTREETIAKFTAMEQKLKAAGYVSGVGAKALDNPAFLKIANENSPAVKDEFLESFSEKLTLLHYSLEKEADFLNMYLATIKTKFLDFSSMSQFTQYFASIDSARKEAAYIRSKNKDIKRLTYSLDEVEAMAVTFSISHLTTGNTNVLLYVEPVLRIERLLKQIEETGQPLLDQEFGGTSILSILQGSYQTFMSLITKIMIESVDTVTTVADRRLALECFGLLERYETYFKRFLPVPEIDEEFERQAINSTFFINQIRPILLIHQLGDLTQTNAAEDSEYAWQLIDELKCVFETNEAQGDEIGTVKTFKPLFQEYKVHWSLADLTRNKFNTFSSTDCHKRLEILENEYQTSVSGLDPELHESWTSPLARNINRKRLATALTEIRETLTARDEQLDNFRKEYEVLLKEIINQLYV